MFKDRVDAGRQLAEEMAASAGGDGLVLAIPRGGVVVGFEVAKRLNFMMDLIIPRKIGSPQNPEVAVGAVTQDGTTIIDRRLADLLGITRKELEDLKNEELHEIRRRMELYGAGKMLRHFKGGQLILVDDGVATGHTMLAALRSARNYQPDELIVAIPVSPRDTLEVLKKEADRVVCLLVPEYFYAVGQYYERFDQTEDFEVEEILRELEDKGQNLEVIYELKKVVAVEEGLSHISNALEREGYSVVRPGASGRIDATVITGMNENVMGMQDITGKSVVIDASGKTANQVLNDLKQRL